LSIMEKSTVACNANGMIRMEKNEKPKWAGALQIALLVMVAIASISSFAFADIQSYAASSGQEGFTQKFSDAYAGQPGSWYPIAMIAILLSIFFNVLLYMAGEAFHDEGLKRYVKAEFLQTTASALMIVFAVTLLYEISGGGAFRIMGEFLGTGGSTIGCAAVQGGRFNLWGTNPGFGSGPIAAFQCKTQERIDAAEACYSNVYSSNKAQEAFTSFCISFYGFPVWCNEWNLAWHQAVEQAHLIATKLVSALITLHAEYALAGYVQSAMLPVFLPIGLILRVAPQTRGVGGLFIAIAIGFFFIWPTFAVLSDPSLVRVNATEQPGAALTQGCFTGFKGAAVVMSTAFASTISGVGLSELSIENCSEALYEITISSIFYPFVAFVIALIAIRAMTPILGGDLGDLMKMVARLG
jgi:hypothetical protein